MKHSYLITGATGFVGSWVARSLAEKGEDVTVIVRDRNSISRIQNIAQKLTLVESHLQDPQLKKKLADIPPTHVFHMAALGAIPGRQPTIGELLDTNVKGLTNLINAIRKDRLELFVNTGSSSEYGTKDRAMDETDLPEPINDYGVSKVAATLYAQKLALKDAFPIITLRLFSPYGYLDDQNRLIPYVINQALKNDLISLSSKTNVRDFVYIDDVVEAYLHTVDKQFNPGEIINIGSGEQYSVYDIVKHVIDITQSSSPITWGEMPHQSRQVEPITWKANREKAQRLLDWKPTFSIEQGLKKTIALYQNN